MHRIKADVFFKGYEQAAVFHQFILAIPKDQTAEIEQNQFSNFVGLLAHVAGELEALGMPATATPFQRALETLRNSPTSEKGGRLISTADQYTLQNWLKMGTSRVADDFSLQCLLAVTPDRLRYYEQPKLFGDDVFNNFPSANEDIAEAGSCVALGRGTACVMHLMRVLEVGLATLARAIGVTKQNDWGSYLREIDKALAARFKAAGARSPDEQFYAETATSMDNMRRAWRNPTMHPEKTYPPERAEEILLSVKSFMSNLATKLRE